MLSTLFRELRWFWLAWRLIRNTRRQTAPVDHDLLLSYLYRLRKKNPTSYFRLAVLEVIRRHKLPYQVRQDWQQAQAEYELYQQLDPINDISKISAGDYLTVISMSYPVKGHRYAEYYSESGRLFADLPVMPTFQVRKVYDGGYVDPVLPSGNYGYNLFDVQQVRFATAEEIIACIDYHIEQELQHAARYIFK